MARGAAPAADPDDGEDLTTGQGEEAGAGELMPWDEEFRDWEQSTNQEKTTTALILYRLDPEGQRPAAHAWKWIDKIPSDHECGLQVGGGKFRAMLTVSKGQKQPRAIKNKIIWLDPIYDEVRAELKQRRALELARAAGTGPAAGPQLGDTIQQMRELMTVFSPLLQGRPAAADPLAALPGLQNMLGGLIKQSFQAQVEAYSRAAQLAGEPKAAAVVSQVDPGQITAKDLWGFALEYGPQILESLGLRDKVAAIFGGKPNGAAAAHVGATISQAG